MQEINYKKFNSEIVEAIKSRGYEENILAFSDSKNAVKYMVADISASELQCGIDNVRANAFVSEYPLEWGSGLKGLIKKIIVKCIRFYTLPVVVKQNQFNASVVDALSEMNDRIESYHNVIEALTEENIKLKTEIEKLRN